MSREQHDSRLDEKSPLDADVPEAVVEDGDLTAEQLRERESAEKTTRKPGQQPSEARR